ncbi:Hypothetical protein, putative [Bodo saltans]|uniref:Uncharacterized protein n=1 Tax=Bodo saltans TaxID=75058 RepID=A0A0S4JP86_BODSA|nr:Hypothetical protein, putative [Bodo saltans]|eukprot:CUG91973.1 Hypothetical protein, putative [Bodo saltans]
MTGPVLICHVIFASRSLKKKWTQSNIPLRGFPATLQTTQMTTTLGIPRGYYGHGGSSQFNVSSCSIETAIFVDNATPHGPHLAASTTSPLIPTTRADDSFAASSATQVYDWRHVHHQFDDDQQGAFRFPTASPRSVSRQQQLFEVVAPSLWKQNEPTATKDGAHPRKSIVDQRALHWQLDPTEVSNERPRSSTLRNHCELTSPERAATVIFRAGGKELYMKKMKELFSTVA